MYRIFMICICMLYICFPRNRQISTEIVTPSTLPTQVYFEELKNIRCVILIKQLFYTNYHLGFYRIITKKKTKKAKPPSHETPYVPQYYLNYTC